MVLAACNKVIKVNLQAYDLNLAVELSVKHIDKVLLEMAKFMGDMSESDDS